jgi:hypothetical protein
MDTQFKERFIQLWQKYFNGPELPVTFYYTQHEKQGGELRRGSGKGCIMTDIGMVRRGKPVRFDAAGVGCFGGKKWLGFSDKLAPNFEYFLSCGIPGKTEGERYKKTPEMVKELLINWAEFKAPAPYLVFKRWDMLDETDDPQVVIFYARADVLSGLYTLANFDVADPNGVIAPMGSGCSSIIRTPYLEKDSEHPRAVLGMFDPSARPYGGPDELTFSVPISKFRTMVENMEESFLITNSWKVIQKRIKQPYSASGF